MAGRHMNWRNLIMVSSFGILIAVELFGVALAGLFELGTIFEYIMMAIFSVFAAYGIVNLMRRMLKIEHLTEVD